MCTAFIYNKEEIATQEDLARILGGPEKIPFKGTPEKYQPDHCLCGVDAIKVAKILNRKMVNDGLYHWLDPFTPEPGSTEEMCSWAEYDPEMEDGP